MQEANSLRYSYNRFGSKGKRVGQAVVDILSEDQPTYTAGEIIDGYAPKFAEELQRAVETGLRLYRPPFYVFVLSHKEMWAENVVRNWFIPRQTAPYALDAMAEYPHRTKTLYLVSPSEVKVVWSLPGIEDCKTVLARKEMYAPELVEWIVKCFQGDFERDCYFPSEFKKVS